MESSQVRSYQQSGCGTVAVLENYLVCRCNHLTDFSAFYIEYKSIENYRQIPGFYEEFNPPFEY